MTMHTPLRLAYVLGRYPQPSETFIAREVAGLRARGHSVEIFSLFAPRGERDATVHYAWATPLQRAWRKCGGPLALASLIRRWRREIAGHFDVVVAHFASFPSTVAMQIAGDLPLVISMHARDIYVEAERLAEKMSCACAVVTCTQANADYLRRHFPGASQNIHAIYHGLPIHWLTARTPLRERDWGEPLRLLAVGRMVEKKGFAILLDACARLMRERKAFTLRLIGDGPLLADLQNQSDELDISPQVNIEPWQSEEALREAYAWADVFCCPSIIAADGDRDGLPNVLMEAMSTGLPAVASAVSAIPEAISDGYSGFLVPPDDSTALAECLTHLIDPTVRQRLGEHAITTIREKFDGEHWLVELERVLEACRS